MEQSGRNAEVALVRKAFRQITDMRIDAKRLLEDDKAGFRGPEPDARRIAGIDVPSATSSVMVSVVTSLDMIYPYLGKTAL